MVSAFDTEKCILVTGAAGFIGFHLIRNLIKEDWFVIGTDSINDYYDVNLKYARLAEWGIPREEIRYNKLVASRYIEKCSFIQLNLEDTENIGKLFETYDIKVVCHLGAQAGVRYSIENPMAYVQSNIVGFTNILENCRKQLVEHLVYASSSSVYGMNARMPFSTHDPVDHPVSFYAATKKANELMAHVYSKLYDLPTTGLRFFTVYGPWGRPDMSPMLFADAIMNNRPIKVFNNGDMGRDFTYIDDIIEGVMRVIKRAPIGVALEDSTVAGLDAIVSSDMAEAGIEDLSGAGSGDAALNEAISELDPSFSTCPYRVYNIGSSSPVRLGDYIDAMEKALGKKAIKEYLPMQPGDVLNTYCDVSELEKDFDYRPVTTLVKGLAEFAKWYKTWYTGNNPLINEQRIVVGKYPFPIMMNWKYIWGKHIEPGFRLSDDEDDLLKSLIVSDGFDCGPGMIQPDAWKAYVARISKKASIKKQESVFEVGCGGGAWLFPLFLGGYRVAGIDYSSVLVHLAKLSMPDANFDVCEANELITEEQSDVVVANSVFQYFKSLDYAEQVLRKMLKKSVRVTLVLNVPDLNTENEELIMRRTALPADIYNNKYKGLSHLYFEKAWFRHIAEEQGYLVHFFEQGIKGYGFNDFRFNCLFTKLV